MIDDELVSQFLMFTGTEDVSKATSYLEMAAGDLEGAVGLFMDHSAPNASGGMGGVGDMMGGGGGGGGGYVDDVRAPDAARSERLIEDGMGLGLGGDGGMMMPPYMQMDSQWLSTAFSPHAAMNVRDAINSAAVAAADSDEENRDHDMDESKENDYEYDDDDDDESVNVEERNHIARLADMFAPPNHLMYSEGGFEGARTMAKDSKRWLLVNIQKDSEFASHALNRDVWRDELVENLVREGFVLWQTFDMSTEGRVYTERYKVYDYPHIGIIDPRTRRLMWKKEGWTQQNPLTASSFAEIAMDFCSQHSFDKPPKAPRPQGQGGAAAAGGGNNRPAKRSMNEMSEDEQLKAAMEASLHNLTANEEQGNQVSADNAMMEDDDDAVEYVGSSLDGDLKPAAKEEETKEEVEEAVVAEVPKPPSLLEELLSMEVGGEPSSGGARIRLCMPDGKKITRAFDPSHSVKVIYAFIAQSNDEAKGGKEFALMAGFPPKDLLDDMLNTIESCKLSGQMITIRWK